ncbi:MAG: DUF2231 domain-containing protein [Proteobacteria bacterium]|nr:DUF2231 domain-containing protein [Pseudomonadota bacterium]
MESRAKLLGHPIHPMLVVFPLGLFATSVIFDVIHLLTDNPELSLVSYWMILSGVIGGLVAAPFGFIDWLAIPKGTRAKSIGLIHGTGNILIVLIFATSWVLRMNSPDAPGMLAYLLSFGGLGLALVTGWLGGELVDRLGVGVYENAHLDAPSSLKQRDDQ